MNQGKERATAKTNAYRIAQSKTKEIANYSTDMFRYLAPGIRITMETDAVMELVRFVRSVERETGIIIPEILAELADTAEIYANASTAIKEEEICKT